MRPFYREEDKSFYHIDRGVTRQEVVEIVKEEIAAQPEPEALVQDEPETTVAGKTATK